MIRNVHDVPQIPPNGDGLPRSTHGRRVYDRSFWFCYVSNAMLMAAVSLLFRYADYVTQIGGNERNLGVIVGVGMIGALAVRVSLGVGIDRYGPRSIWLGSLLLYIAAAAAHLTIQSIHDPLVYPVRIMLTIGIAGSVGASLTYISLRVPENRIAEMVGTIGTSGFVGLAIGPILGDLLFQTAVVTRTQVNRMFLLAAAAAAVSLVFAALATRGQVRSSRRRAYPSLFALVRRYHPGVILWVALAMGLGIGLPGVFVRAYAAELGFIGIQTFFLVYATVAFTVRIATRRLTQQIGIRSVIVIGLSTLALSMTLYLTVHQSWQLAIPAAIAGVAHALLFPAVVAGGSLTFPIRYRGLATTLVLAMFDLGNLIGQPAVGNALYYAGKLGVPKYPVMFLSVALLLALVAAVYARFASRENRISARRTFAPRKPDGGGDGRVEASRRTGSSPAKSLGQVRGWLKKRR